MDFIDNEIDKWWCSQFTDYPMKRIPYHKFVPYPAKNEDGSIRAYELLLDWKVDADAIDWDGETIRNLAQHFYNLGKKSTQKITLINKFNQ